MMYTWHAVHSVCFAKGAADFRFLSTLSTSGSIYHKQHSHGVNNNVGIGYVQQVLKYIDSAGPETTAQEKVALTNR
jgi:hypothetical protein